MSRFQVTPDLVFPEIKIVEYDLKTDNRGFFTEIWSDLLQGEIGMEHPTQVNISESNFGIIRGIHWQREPWSQGKLVSCINGAIHDIVVDIRRDSSTCGKHISFNLDVSSQRAIWVPRGFGHGFQALSDQARIMYFVDNAYKPDHEESLYPLDEDLGIQWEIQDSIISPKDLSGMTFSSYMNIR